MSFYCDSCYINTSTKYTDNFVSATKPLNSLLPWFVVDEILALTIPSKMIKENDTES